MTGWLIAALIVLFFAAVFCVRVRLTVTYADELQLRVRVLGIPFRLYPRPEKPLKLRRYTPKAQEKLRRKQAEKQAKKQSRKEKKQRDKQLHPGQAKKKKSVRDAAAQIRFITRLIFLILRRFFGYLRTEVSELSVVVATGDAASTAVAYGAASQAVCALLALLRQTRNFRIRAGTRVTVTPDFLAESSSARIRITFSIRPYQCVALLLSAAFGFLKGRGEGKTEKASGRMAGRSF